MIWECITNTTQPSSLIFQPVNFSTLDFSKGNPSRERSIQNVIKRWRNGENAPDYWKNGHLFFQNCNIKEHLSGSKRVCVFETFGAKQGRGRTLCDAWHIFCLDHPTKSDVTSGKKASWAAKLNLNATSSFSLQLKDEDFVIGRMFLTFNLAIITRILSSSSPYRLFEELGNYLLKNTPFWRHVLSRNVVISSSLNSAGVIVCVEIMNSR